MSEIWKPIRNFEGYYVSNLGRFQSHKSWNGSSLHFLHPSKTRKGYFNVSLRKNGKTYQFLAHRLVADAFIPNPLNLPQINHINENKADNRVQNLEWCNNSYNMNYGTRTQRQIDKVSKPVVCVETGTVYASSQSAAQKMGVCQSGISRCCIGKAKTAGGFHWRYHTKAGISSPESHVS